MSGFLFLISIYSIMKTTTSGTPTEIRWKFTYKLEDLDFAKQDQQVEIKAESRPNDKW